MNRHAYLAFVGLLCHSLAAGETFVDDFDSADINERWLVQRNAVGSVEIAQEDGHAVVTATGVNANGGLASVASFDPLADGVNVSFVITEIVGRHNANGFLVGVVDDNRAFHRNTNNFGIAAFGQEPRTFSSGGFSLIVGDRNGSNEADFILDEGEAVDMESYQDGFIVTLAADEAGWSYIIEGLADAEGNDRVFENQGTWADAGTSFQEIFGQDREWHVVTANQSPGEIITRFDQITLGDPKPKSDPDIRVPSRLSLGQLPSFPRIHESTLAVRNAGESEVLQVSGVELSGPDAEHFTILGDQLPLAIPAGGVGELTFSIDNLGKTGSFRATFTLLTNDPAPEEDRRLPIEVTASVINLNGPIAHYALDEALGPEMRDVTGYNRAGLYDDAVVLGQEGLAGGTAIRVGAGAAASVSGGAFDEGTFQEFSVSLWFRADDVVETQTLFASGLQGGSPSFALLLTQETLSWYLEEAPDFSTVGAKLEPDKVHHAVVTYSGDRAAIFLDGEEQAGQDDPSAFDHDPAAPFFIGAFGPLGFSGIVDDVQIYNRALDAADVAFLHDHPGGELGTAGPVDSDGDGLSDEEETNIHSTDPLVVDTDGDGLNDGDEVAANSNPLEMDSDGGGTWDGFEAARGTDPTNAGDDPPVWTVRTLKSRSALSRIAHVEALLRDQSFSEEIIGQHTTINFLGTGQSGNFQDDRPFDNIEAVEAMNVDDFAVIATTDIFIDETGTYTFGFNSDDGGRLKVGDAVVALFDSTRGAGDSLGKLSLTPGFHRVEVLMFDRGGGSALEVYWDSAPGDSSESFDPGRHRLLSATELRRADGDGDELDDNWERTVFGHLDRDGTGDADGDGLLDRAEHDQQTDPNAGDTDGDGLDDGPEVNQHQTNPLVADTDGDRRSDGEEVNGDPSSNPLDEDTDDDGFRDGFEVAQNSDPNNAASLPADRLGEPDESWHSLQALPSFNGFRGGDDQKDVTFRAFIDFTATDATEDEREIIWESGGGAIGFSLVYETGNKLILRAAGNGGNVVATVEHQLTVTELAAGELPVIWTFDVDNGDPEAAQTIALFLADSLVGSESRDLGPDWTGSNAASFGVGSNSFAAGGGNSALNNGVDFRSGSINLDAGLQFFTERLFDPSDVVSPPVALSVSRIVKGESAVRLEVAGEPGTSFTVEYSTSLEPGSWTETGSGVISAGGTTTTEDSHAARLAAPLGFYRLLAR